MMRPCKSNIMFCVLNLLNLFIFVIRVFHHWFTPVLTYETYVHNEHVSFDNDYEVILINEEKQTEKKFRRKFKGSCK